jgi:hypothetical protein
VSGFILLLGLEPVGQSGRGGGGARILALDLDGEALILLQAASQIGLLGGGGGLGGGEDLDLAVGVGGLDGGELVALDALEVELLNEVGCTDSGLA